MNDYERIRRQNLAMIGFGLSVILFSILIATLSGCGNVEVVPDDADIKLRGMSDTNVSTDQQNPGAGGITGTGGIIVQNGTGGMTAPPVSGMINVSTWIQFTTNTVNQGTMHACIYDNDLYGTRNRDTICAWKYGVAGNLSNQSIVPAAQIVKRWDSSSVVDLNGYSSTNQYAFTITADLMLNKNYLLVISQGGNDNPANYCGSFPFLTTHPLFAAVEFAWTQTGEVSNIIQSLKNLNSSSEEGIPNFTTDCDHTTCTDPCGCPGPQKDPGCMSGGA